MSARSFLRVEDSFPASCCAFLLKLTDVQRCNCPALSPQHRPVSLAKRVVGSPSCSQHIDWPADRVWPRSLLVEWCGLAAAVDGGSVRQMDGGQLRTEPGPRVRRASAGDHLTCRLTDLAVISLGSVYPRARMHIGGHARCGRASLRAAWRRTPGRDTAPRRHAFIALWVMCVCPCPVRRQVLQSIDLLLCIHRRVHRRHTEMSFAKFFPYRGPY